MKLAWVLSPFHEDHETGWPLPVAAAYAHGRNWHAPQLPETEGERALVLVLATNDQLEAMGQDERLVICPLLGQAPGAVVEVYQARGVVAGMTIAQAIEKLAEWEPKFKEDWGGPNMQWLL